VLGGVNKCLGPFVVQRQGSQVCFSYQVRLFYINFSLLYAAYMFN
jgi:hypothetical protein